MVKAGWMAPIYQMVGERNAKDEMESKKAWEEQKRIRAQTKAKRAKKAATKDGWGLALALTAQIAVLPFLAAAL